MEGGYGGNVGGGGRFFHQNLQPTANLQFLRPRPLLSTIDSFLWGSQNSFPHNQGFFINNFTTNSHELLNSSGSSSGGMTEVFMNVGGGGVSPLLPRPIVPPPSSFGFDGVSQSWTIDAKETMANSQPSENVDENSKGNSRKGKDGNVLTKGQWTEDEDRELIKLVKQFGVKKWASIAEKIKGRVGKQCRERWHNHLRPNIKKETWSEEEERLLVEAHSQVGNRWAEIAKRIPDRTENSIKNHWNATKRKQSSKRKSKKVEGQIGNLPQSTVLLDYIKHAFPKNDYASTSASVAAATPKESTISDDPDHDSPFYYLTEQSQFDEMNFMQSWFAPDINGTFVDSGIGNSADEVQANHPVVVDENSGLSMQSDDYISRLLEGGGTMAPPAASPQNYSNMNMMNDEEIPPGREMDLIEIARQLGYIL